MMTRIWIILLATVLLSGCANQARVEIRDIEPVAPIVQEPQPPQTSGSLYTERQGSLFLDMKARTVGDIVTVAIFENASASKEASTSTSRDSSMSAGITNLFGLEKYIGSLGNAQTDNTALVNAATENDFSGSGKTSRSEDLVATLTTQIVEVMPNGNLRIEGNKTVTVNSEKQIVKLSGIIRPPDISPANIVNSKNILNARIAYLGEGVVSDKQQQGWLVRYLDGVWPF